MNKKYFLLITALLVLMGGAKAARINTNAGIVAKQLYQIRASEQSRGALNASNKTNDGVESDGYLSACGSTLTTANGYKEYKDVSINTAKEYQQFAFIQVGSNYYLYNRGAKKLCYVDGNYIRFGTTVQTVTLTAVTYTGRTDCALIQFGTSNKFLTFSNNDAGKFAIYAQSGIQATTNDGGCALQINSIDGVTLTEAELLYAQNLIDERCYTAMTDASAALVVSQGNKVGYPTASQCNTLSAALTTFQNLFNNSTATNADLTTLNNAINTFKTTTDINYPEDGKAYKIIAVHPNGKRQPLYYNGSAVSGKLEENITDIYDAYWICHKTSNTENKYLFANHNGFYLNWFCGDADKGVNRTGVSTTYNADYNVWTLARATTTKSGGTISNNTTNATFFGCFELNAKGTGSNYYYLITRYNNSGTASFHAGGANDKYYDNSNNNTFIYQLVEVDYFNKLKFQTPATTDGNDYASIYLPYAATVPAGATAYKGALTNDNSRLTLTPIEGTTIPKNTAVVLVAPSTSNLGTVYVVPATEAGPTVSGNSLQGTVETSARNSAIHTYVLNGGNGPIGFYEYTANNLPKGRAYFETANQVPSNVSGTNAKGYLFDFGNGETTGISNATIGNEAETTYYDLSGRRIAAPKHGLYIRNGKKVYIK